MSIRIVREEEIDKVIDFGNKFHKEAKGYNNIEFDVDKLRHYGHNVWYKDPNWFHMAAFDENENVYGMFVGYVDEYYFSTQKYACDLILFIEETKRGGFAVVKMVRSFEKWAKAKGALEIRPAVTSGIDINRTKGFYEKMGYQITGHNFRKDIA
jgi:hypothetical protein